MLLNCNCAKLANFEDIKTCLGGVFRGHSVVKKSLVGRSQGMGSGHKNQSLNREQSDELGPRLTLHKSSLPTQLGLACSDVQAINIKRPVKAHNPRPKPKSFYITKNAKCSLDS